MLKGNVLAIDLAKTSFHMHLATEQGRVIKRQKISRAKVLDFVAKSDAAFDSTRAALQSGSRPTNKEAC